MEVKYFNIEELKEYENNPRKNLKAIDFVANSIKQFGFKVPIVIDKENTIIAGHTRYRASKKLGIKQIPCVVADDLTDEQIKAFRIADNRVSELAEWDYDCLQEELDEIYDIKMSDFGFEEEKDYNFIDDLQNEKFSEPNTAREYFTITFSFSSEIKEYAENYLKENGKEKLLDELIKICC